MNTDWETAIAFVLKMEGGYTVDPNDPGGETNFGISKKSYPSLDIKDLSVDLATEIYRLDYWQECRCDELPSALAISVFDTAVNQGVTKAKRLLQIALDVKVDGIIGDKTIAAAFKSDSHAVKLFLAHRLDQYAATITANLSLHVFAINWTYRVLSLAELIFSGKTV